MSSGELTDSTYAKKRVYPRIPEGLATLPTLHNCCITDFHAPGKEASMPYSDRRK